MNWDDIFNLPRTHVFHGLPTIAHSITQHGLLGYRKLRDRSERERCCIFALLRIRCVYLGRYDGVHHPSSGDIRAYLGYL